MSRLPREFIWNDVDSMDDFLSSPLNKKLYEAYLQVKDAPFRISIPDIQLFNELYYLCTALIAKEIQFKELEQEIFAYFGRDYAKDLLISLIYSVFTLQKDMIGIYNVFGDDISSFFSSYSKGWYFDYFANFVSEQKILYQTDFSPRPEEAKLLAKRNIDWKILTNNYCKDDIMRILQLWTTPEEKLIVLSTIESSCLNNNDFKKELIETKIDGITTWKYINQFDSLRELINATDFLANYKKKVNLEESKEETKACPFITYSKYADKILSKIRDLLKGKTSPRDKMKPIRAAIDAGVIRRPTFGEIESFLGKVFVSNTSYHNYTDPQKDPYSTDNSYKLLVSEFKKLIE